MKLAHTMAQFASSAWLGGSNAQSLALMGGLGLRPPRPGFPSGYVLIGNTALLHPGFGSGGRGTSQARTFAEGAGVSK